MKHIGVDERGPEELNSAVGYFVEQVVGILEVVTRELQEPQEQLSQEMVTAVGFSWGFE